MASFTKNKVKGRGNCFAYQSQRLGDQGPSTQEPSDDKATEDGLDLWYTTMLRIDGILLNQDACTDSKGDLSPFGQSVDSMNMNAQRTVDGRGVNRQRRV